MERLLEGKIALVTGAGSGIGKQTAIGLAKRGATVVLVAGDREGGAVLKQEVRRISGSDAVELLVGDLSSHRAVHQIVEDFRARWDRLSVLVNGAGGLFRERQLTVDGIERTFAVNYLSAFQLTNLLTDELCAGAPSRVVNVASRAHRSAHLDFDDLQSERDYSPQRAYAQAKLATILFTYELASRFDGSGVTVNCVEPRRTPRRGARSLVHVAAAPELETVSAECFSKSGGEKRTSSETYDPAVAAELWEASEALVGVPVG